MIKNQGNLKQYDLQQGMKTTVSEQLAKVIRLKRQLIDIHIKETGLSRTQWQTLYWLNKSGSCTQQELLKNLEIDAAHLARILDKLEQKEYITRTPIKDDRRCLFIQMTAYTKNNLIPKILAAVDKEEFILLDNINDRDKIHLIELLSKLELNLETALKMNYENLEP